MSLSPDNFTALINLKDKARKWKNIAFFMLFVALILFCRIFFGNNDNVSNIETGNYIANIAIEGVILDDEYRSIILEKIAQQKNIKAVIVNINSPGGGIVSSEILYNNLRAIAKNKPIVVIMGSLAASGGYMSAIASDHIIARNGTLTGSIGVIIQTSEFTELASRLGIKLSTYKSSILKGSPSPFEKSNPKVDEMINDSIKDSYQFFTDLVKERRGNKLSKSDNILDGRIFTGRQALKNGLIDEIGGKAQALNYLKDKYKIDIIKYPIKKVDLQKPEKSIIGQLIGKENMTQIISKMTGFDSNWGQFMSIWRPSSI
jgi:protease-4